MTIKGERGLILAVIPLETPNQEQKIVKEVLNDLDWRLVTVRLLKPLIEGIFQFNNHFFKYPEETRTKLLNYLNDRYMIKDEEVKTIDKYDFVLAHHLVTDQIMVYSFLHLNTNTKNLFKVPAQKKKLFQFLLSQISRFESNQKGQKKHLIHRDLVPLVESFLHHYQGQKKYFILDRKSIKGDKDSVLRSIENFTSEDKNEFNFPTSHL